MAQLAGWAPLDSPTLDWPNRWLVGCRQLCVVREDIVDLSSRQRPRQLVPSGITQPSGVLIVGAPQSTPDADLAIRARAWMVVSRCSASAHA